MNCNLVDNWFGVRFRAAKRPDFGLMTRCIPRDRRFRWMMPNGGYALHRNDAQPATDDDLVVATALRSQTTITETLNFKDPFAFPAIRNFACRALSPGGVMDDAPAPDSHKINFLVPFGDDPTEIFPSPPSPISFFVQPSGDGKIVVLVDVNNINAATQATEVSIYTDGGSGGAIDYAQPLGAREPVGSGYGQYRIERDPGLAHGATLSVAVLTRSASGDESDQAAESSTPQSVVIDSQGPPALAGFTVETVC